MSISIYQDIKLISYSHNKLVELKSRREEHNPMLPFILVLYMTYMCIGIA